MTMLSACDISLELAERLADLSEQIYKDAAALREGGYHQEPPPRRLTWQYQQTLRPDGYPITWLQIELNLVAQSPDGADEDLVRKLADILGEDRFTRAPRALPTFPNGNENQVSSVGKENQVSSSRNENPTG